jgi:general secretion pathway protein G
MRKWLRQSGRSSQQTAAGFTLVELMIVMLIIAVLASIAIPSYVSTLRAGREAVLREDLHVLRGAIDGYTIDKGKPPQALDDLVQAGYLHEIPVDPTTHSRDTWVANSDQSYNDPDQTEPGITTVYSGSEEVGSDGQPYSKW